MILARVTAIVLAWFLLSAQTGDDGFADTLDEAFGKDTLIISADRHACWLFDIYVASTRSQQMRGLMHVRELPDFTGMIFIYRRADIRSMWMRNTYIPLDMLFIDAGGKIVHIVERTVPQSLTTISAGRPVRAVLEVNAGTVRRLQIRTGDRVVHPLFGNAG